MFKSENEISNAGSGVDVTYTHSKRQSLMHNRHERFRLWEMSEVLESARKSSAHHTLDPALVDVHALPDPTSVIR